MTFFFDSDTRNKYVDTMKELCICEDIVSCADDICHHNFNLLGSGNVNLGKKINWHRDYISGYVWPFDCPAKLIKTIDLSNNADVKIPWELSRFQHLVCLGQAYWLTGNINYINEIIEQVCDWIECNPIGTGVNWASTMDVAIRAVNLLTVWHYIPETGFEYFKTVLYEHIKETGSFIFNNLEGNAENHGNNHYLAGLASLIWVGLFINEGGQHTQKWIDTGKNGLEDEMNYQINVDGTDFEGSIPYHCLVTEIFLSTTILSEINGIHFPGWYNKKLKKMCTFIMHFTKPDGLTPQIGDSDSGRFIIMSGYGKTEKRDSRHILSAAGEYFNCDYFRQVAGGSSRARAEAIWLTDRLTNKRWHNISKETEGFTEGISVHSYEYGGIHIIRDKNVYILIRCGRFGFGGTGGHGHNDQLSIILNLNCKDIFADSGTYVYSSDFRERNNFRCTAAHNTPRIKKYEQNPFDKRKIFTLLDRTKADTIRIISNDKYALFEGCHEGYFANNGAICFRRVIYKSEDKMIEICDRFSKNIPFINGFTLDDAISYKIMSDRTLVLDDTVIFKTESGYKITDAYISKSYGTKCITKRIEVFCNGSENIRISFK